MIVSKYGKSYDTADGTEQQHGVPLTLEPKKCEAEHNWEDEGGTVANEPLLYVGELSSRPAWSVRSLCDINNAILRDARARQAQEAARSERAEIAAIEARQVAEAEAIRREANSYRNAWEHT